MFVLLTRVKNMEHAGSCSLSCRGKNAQHSDETAEGVAGSGAKELKKTWKSLVLKSMVMLLAVLLVFSLAIAVFEYNSAASLQSRLSEQDNALAERGKVITWLDTALNLTQLTLKMKPPNGHQYLATLPDSDNQGKVTKIYLDSTTPGYSYDPYTWPFTAELRDALEIPTGNGSIRLPDFGWSYLLGNYSISMGSEPLLMIGVTVRNDYTPADAGNGTDPSAPVGNRSGSYVSVVNLAARLYDKDGNIIQAPNAAGIPAPTASSPTAKGGLAFLLVSDQTKQVIFYLSPSGIDINDIDHYEIYVSSVSAY